ncbi:MAG: alcohol dehydrogenase catalytic domain-containing protein [Candidatus Kapabacteria bacterium]|nr:alcohol dehydrogenase catalytic domain-containing protein [Candidatus Kapabacteria bacterium]MDW8012578.1 alcohol dehydrogenase catalytic domain-containing protein [Bacteroidota bacterium]
MRAVVLQAHGEPHEALTYRVDLPEPTPAPGEVVLRVRATSLNRVDTVIRRGYPGLTLQFPHILGGDIVGDVVACGEGVQLLREGTRVLVYPIVWCGTCSLCRKGLEHLCLRWQYFGMHRAGGYAEYVAVPERCCIPLPEHLSDVEAACLGVAGLTAYHAIEAAGVSEGSILLVWGATGGMGTFLLQLARHRGAYVIATTRRMEQAELLHSWGADWVLPTLPPEAVLQAVQERFPEGIDAVIDYVGPATFPISFALLRKGGRLIFCGILTGRETTLSIHQTYLRHVSLHGIYLGTRAELQALIGLVTDGIVRPYVAGVHPLSEAPLLHQRMEAGAIVGKTVMVP